MTTTILTLNAGSSSVKYALFGRGTDLPLLAHGNEALTGGETHEHAVRRILDSIHSHAEDWQIAMVAHRIVHGGAKFTAPVRVTADVFHELKLLCPLAPLHQPHNLAALGIAERLLPHVPQIACFDTAFHARHDPLFSAYAVPQELAAKGVRRYGFHGLSYAWIAQMLQRDEPELAKGRVIVAHLGNGASLCAMVGGISIDTTMGMTTLDGLPMGTRSGSLDPAAVIYMIRDLGMTPDEAEHTLYEKSGLKGLSSLTNDVRALLASPDPRAAFALDYYALKVAQHVAMLAVSVGGIDALIFTGGIGENAASVRDAVLQRLAPIATPRVLVIPANEERMMAMETWRLD